MPIESIALALRARFLAAIAAALLAVPTAAPHADAPAASSAAPAEGPVRHEEIQEAVAKLAGDANLGGGQKWRVLRWRRSQAPPANTPSWAGGFFGFLAQSMSVLLLDGGWRRRRNRGAWGDPMAACAPVGRRIQRRRARPERGPLRSRPRFVPQGHRRRGSRAARDPADARRRRRFCTTARSRARCIATAS